MALIPSYSPTSKNYNFLVKRITELYQLEESSVLTLPKTFTTTEKQLFVAGNQAEKYLLTIAQSTPEMVSSSAKEIAPTIEH